MRCEAIEQGFKAGFTTEAGGMIMNSLIIWGFVILWELISLYLLSTIISMDALGFILGGTKDYLEEIIIGGILLKVALGIFLTTRKSQFWILIRNYKP